MAQGEQDDSNESIVSSHGKSTAATITPVVLSLASGSDSSTTSRGTKDSKKPVRTRKVRSSSEDEELEKQEEEELLSSNGTSTNSSSLKTVEGSIPEGASTATAAAADDDDDDEPIVTAAMAAEEAEAAAAREAEMEAEREAFRQSELAKASKEVKFARLTSLLEKTSMYSEFLRQKISKPGVSLGPSSSSSAAATSSSSSSSTLPSAQASSSTNNGSQPSSMDTSEGLQGGTGSGEGNEGSDEKDGGDEKGAKVGGKRKKGVSLNQGETPAKKRSKNEAPAGDDSAEPSGGLSLHGSLAQIEAAAAGMTQPKLITGGTLRSYQLVGVDWLVSLYENGLNGILADEMGLGKTLQTISFLAHLAGNGVWGPHLVVAPLSTLGNWVREFKRFAPDIPVMLYHGSKDEREELRRKHLWKGNPKFPIVVTSYELIMRDSKWLRTWRWKYIVVDEGHRLKNMNSKLIRMLKSFPSSNRLLLTGTPLQNNLTELWSLLNFLLPDVFNDLDSFQSWFDFGDPADTSTTGGPDPELIAKEQEQAIVTKLHEILRPFVLRRLKTEVEVSLPLKREIVVYTSLVRPRQALLYKSLVEGKGHDVIKRKMSLDSLTVQLRKTCNHPYLFEWPKNRYGEEVFDESIVTSSGKMQVLARMLFRLQAGGHKVLIFSQMTKMLDILEDLCSLRGYRYCRIDGSTKMPDRDAAMNSFNTDPGLFLFLLSTRAGGLGINLVSADTVIIYDSDWNPQMDLQAQDRVHRIGQKKSVMVYRLVTRSTVETRILAVAQNKRSLEKLVMHKSKFKGAAGAASSRGWTDGMSASELLELMKSDVSAEVGAGGDVLSDAELDQIMDRTLMETTKPVQKLKYTGLEDDDDDNDDEEEGGETAVSKPAAEPSTKGKGKGKGNAAPAGKKKKKKMGGYEVVEMPRQGY